MLLKIKSNLLVAVCLIILASCVKDQVAPAIQPVENKKLTGKVQLGNTALSLSMYSSTDSFFVGYNPVYFTITDTTTNTKLTNAAITIQPVMDMITMQHSCPKDQPVYTSDGLFKAACVFTMATENKMGWVVNVQVAANGSTYNAVLPVTVKPAPANTKLVTSVNDQANTTYYIALVSPLGTAQRVGANDLEVALYKKNDMMNFVPVDGMVLDFTPTMPSMGHSSPGNMAPVGIGNGHYKGRVNYTMTGDWRLTFSLSGNGSTFSNTAYLDVLF